MGKVKLLKENHVIVIKIVNPDMTSRAGFRWKKRGFVKCDDWEPAKKCGNGLHGLLWGRGDGGLLNWSKDSVWLCLSVDKRKIIDLGDKVKFPECWVLKAGKRKDVLTYAAKHGLDLKNCVGGWSISSGDGLDSNTLGYYSNSSSSGEYSKSSSFGKHSESSSSGRYSKSSSFGEYSKSSSSGRYSKSSSFGEYSKSSSSGPYSKSSSSGPYSESNSFGNHSESNSFGTESSSNSSGHCSKSSSFGIGSTSISSGPYSRSKSFDNYSKSVSVGKDSISSSDGNHSRSCSIGDHCMSTTKGKRTISMVNGLNGKASSGPGGVFALPWKDKDGNLHIAVGEVGKNGIKPDVLYKVGHNGKLIEAREKI